MALEDQQEGYQSGEVIGGCPCWASSVTMPRRSLSHLAGSLASPAKSYQYWQTRSIYDCAVGQVCPNY